MNLHLNCYHHQCYPHNFIMNIFSVLLYIFHLYVCNILHLYDIWDSQKFSIANLLSMINKINGYMVTLHAILSRTYIQYNWFIIIATFSTYTAYITMIYCFYCYFFYLYLCHFSYSFKFPYPLTFMNPLTNLIYKTFCSIFYFSSSQKMIYCHNYHKYFYLKVTIIKYR